jgi:radical SAM family uncharacterized protein
VLIQPDITSKLEKILPLVQKPGRYTGGEYNQVVKDWQNIPIKLALVFPDIYDIGMSNLGLSILYDQINQREDALAERAFSPWVDMENLLRKQDIPLYSLETKHSLSQFDIIGISLPYETLYTNALNILDLARIPIFSKDRAESEPLVIAGGHATFNPEPMFAFFDAFVIGEGEEIIHEIIDQYKHWKNNHQTRKKLIEELARIWGVYIPSFYQIHYHSNHTISQFEPLVDHASLPVLKRIVPVLPPPPVKLIVPYIETVHSRIPLEIMRGCTRGCRFCQAGMVTRPVRERSVDEIIKAIEETTHATGYEEVGLLSLSSSDYTHIVELVGKLNEKFGDMNLSISLPSLRIDSVSVDLMTALQSSRGGGFTLAPEAATERMRTKINKPLSTNQFLSTVAEIYSRGWPTIKLYFMIGLPSETMDDVQAIADLCKSILSIGRQRIGKRASVHAGISTFIPKPHTPFQWESCDTIDNIYEKQSLIKRELKSRNFKVTWVKPEETMLEALLSRGDRSLAPVIYQAWKLGAKFDAWSEHFSYDTWKTALASLDIDPAFFIHRNRSQKEILPWDHISIAVHKEFLISDNQMSIEGKIRSDCRENCYACGILPTFNKIRQQTLAEAWKCPPIKTSQ